MSEKKPVEPYYQNVGQWVVGFALPHYRRGPSTLWDPAWYNHPEAVSVLESLWQAWEHLRVEGGPTGMAVFWRDYFYPLMDRLTAPDGPFYLLRDPMKRGQLPEGFESAPFEDSWFTPLPAPEPAEPAVDDGEDDPASGW